MSENQEQKPRKVFLSCLGTTNYVKVPYSALNEAERAIIEQSEQTAFIQVARLRALEARSERPEAVIILTTEEARSRNVLRAAPTNYDPLPKDTYDGLDVELDALQYESAKSLTHIPEGASLTELWQIFNVVLAQTKEGDELYLDITHGFRSLSAILILALSFALKARKAKLKEVSYGAWEVIKPASNRDARPTFDLTPFFVLTEWTDAVHVFRVSRDLRPLADVFGREATNIKRRAHKNAPVSFGNAAKALDELAKSMVLCDIPRLPDRARKALSGLRGAQADLLRPEFFELAPARYLLDDIILHIEPLTGGQKTDWQLARAGFAAAEWSFSGFAYQAAFTFLRESMPLVMSLHLRSTKALPECTNTEGDAVLNCIIASLNPNTSPRFADARVEAGYNKLMQQNDLKHVTAFATYADRVAKARNALNHAGMGKEPVSTKTLERIHADMKTVLFPAILKIIGVDLR